ncbi:MAG: hypothetical protein GX663_03525 [Clostridiales bacterium]|nr:hypothetical protein [Clostridiales bacterium]
MIAPERWYEYQTNYEKYGFDMKPQPEPRRSQKRKRVPRKLSVPFTNGRKLAFSAVLAFGIVTIIMIILAAYMANLRYDINNMIKENNALTGEIENLQVKIYSANNVDYIEGKATGELGMIYSKTKDRVYISMDDIPEKGFADIIKEKAYN